MNRSGARVFSPLHGAAEAVADYDAAIGLIESLRAQLGEERWWKSVESVVGLARAYLGRANVLAQGANTREMEQRAETDLEQAQDILQSLVDQLGERCPAQVRQLYDQLME